MKSSSKKKPTTQKKTKARAAKVSVKTKKVSKKKTISGKKYTVFRKCKGCGKTLSIDPKDLGFTPNVEFDYCQRCFQLKHYGKNSHVEDSKVITTEVLNNLVVSENDWVVLVNDIINIDFFVLDKYKKHPKLLFVFNKSDLIVTDRNRMNIVNNLVKILAKHDVQNPIMFLTSTRLNYGVKKLNEFIFNENWNDKFYFIGQSNSGKSSLINALIDVSGSLAKPLTISNFLNTTIDVKKLKISKHDVIDTPGYSSEYSVLMTLASDKDIKNVLAKQNFKPRTFQISGENTFFANNLAHISVSCPEKGSVTFFMSNAVNIQRVKKANLEKNLQNKTINKFEVNTDSRKNANFTLYPEEKFNITICGLGLILIKGCSSVIVNTFEKVTVTLLEEVII